MEKSIQLIRLLRLEKQFQHSNLMLVLLFISSPRFAPGFPRQSGLNCSVSANIKGLAAWRKIFFRNLQPKIAHPTVPPKPDQSEMPIFHRQKRERDRSFPIPTETAFQKLIYYFQNIFKPKTARMMIPAELYFS